MKHKLRKRCFSTLTRQHVLLLELTYTLAIYRFNDITNLNKIWFVSWTVLYKSENIQWQIIFLKEWLFGSLSMSNHTFPPLIPNPKPFSCVRINFTFHFKIGSVLIVRIELCFINSISWSWFVFFKVFLFSTKISSLIRKSTLKFRNKIGLSVFYLDSVMIKGSSWS